MVNTACRIRELRLFTLLKTISDADDASCLPDSSVYVSAKNGSFNLGLYELLLLSGCVGEWFPTWYPPTLQFKSKSCHSYTLDPVSLSLPFSLSLFFQNQAPVLNDSIHIARRINSNWQEKR